MFRTLLTLFLVSFFCLTLNAQQTDSVAIPASVKATFAAAYPHATGVHWKRTNSFTSEHLKYVYRVKFRNGDYIISAATDSTGSRFAEFLKETYLPEGLWIKFMSLLPGAEIRDCSTGNLGKVVMPHAGHYSVLFTYSSDANNYDGCAIFDSLFNVLEIWKDIPHNKLPANISKYINDNFKGLAFSQEEGSMMVQENGQTTYFVSLEMEKNEGSYWLFFNDKGELTKKEAHRWKTIGL
jgi:hypothetical protein